MKCLCKVTQPVRSRVGLDPRSHHCVAQEHTGIPTGRRRGKFVAGALGPGDSQILRRVTAHPGGGWGIALQLPAHLYPSSLDRIPPQPPLPAAHSQSPGSLPSAALLPASGYTSAGSLPPSGERGSDPPIGTCHCPAWLLIDLSPCLDCGLWEGTTGPCTDTCAHLAPSKHSTDSYGREGGKIGRAHV